MAGTLTATTIQNDTSSPPTFRNSTREIGTLCRAWVNFDGTGTPSIRASFNVSSITDNGAGDYTVNFTNAFADANYSVVCANGVLDGNSAKSIASLNRNNATGAEVAPTTTAVRISSGGFNNADLDVKYFNVAVFR